MKTIDESRYREPFSLLELLGLTVGLTIMLAYFTAAGGYWLFRVSGFGQKIIELL